MLFVLNSRQRIQSSSLIKMETYYKKCYDELNSKLKIEVIIGKEGRMMLIILPLIAVIIRFELSNLLETSRKSKTAETNSRSQRDVISV